MKKTAQWILGLTALFISFQSVQAFQTGGFFAQSLQPSDTCVIPKVNGERVPFPIQKANTKFELSENETYLLNGTLVVQNNRVYLKLDFDSQPWLATARVVQFPYFLVESIGVNGVNHFAGKLVQVAVVARKQEQNPHEAGQDLKLTSIMPPVAL